MTWLFDWRWSSRAGTPASESVVWCWCAAVVVLARDAYPRTPSSYPRVAQEAAPRAPPPTRLSKAEDWVQGARVEALAIVTSDQLRVTGLNCCKKGETSRPDFPQGLLGSFSYERSLQQEPGIPLSVRSSSLSSRSTGSTIRSTRDKSRKPEAHHPQPSAPDEKRSRTRDLMGKRTVDDSKTPVHFSRSSPSPFHPLVLFFSRIC